MAEKEEQLADMATLAGALAAGKHADADASAERYEAIRAAFDALTASSDAYRADLEAAIEREEQLDFSLKKYNDGAARLTEWMQTCQTIVDDTAHATSGVGMDVVVAKDDNFRSEYEANADEMTELQESLDALAQELTDGGHPEAGTVDAKQGELRGLSYVLEAHVCFICGLLSCVVELFVRLYR